MSPAKTNSDGDTLSEDAIVELLRDSSSEPENRLDRLERALSGSDSDISEALVTLATADQHVLLAPESRYQEFTDLCSAAADRDDSVSTESVLRASLDAYDRVETLAEDIRSLPTLSDPAVEDRLSMLDTITATSDRDSVAQSGEGVSHSADPGGQSDDSSVADTRSSAPTETEQTMAAQSQSTIDEPAPQEPVTTAPGTGHQGIKQPAQRTDPTESGALSMPNYAQDLVDFEFVMEENEEYLPESVNGSGIVVTDENEYVGILRIKPRSWSIHTDAKKTEIVNAYKSSFLATLDFPIQIVSYPTKFDISDHVTRLEEVAEEHESNSDDTTLVSLGRNLYPNWLERFILDNDMKQRQFYVVVPITADQLNEFQANTEGFLDTLAEKAPPLEPLAEKFSDDAEQQDVSREQCVRELRSRLSRIESGLRRFDVGAERLDDRDEVMSVIYHYYNNEQPMNDAFPTGPYSVADEPDTEE